MLFHIAHFNKLFQLLQGCAAIDQLFCQLHSGSKIICLSCNIKCCTSIQADCLAALPDILDVQFRFGSDEEDVAEVEALFGDGVTFTDVLIQAQQQRGLYYAFATLVYGFLSIIVAITIFHIMNTISMGVSARTRQYGVMRAIGMSNQQLTRMISAEAASYAISGVILGCIFGLLFHGFLYSSLITRTFGNPWSVPWLELCLIVGVILATTALAVRGPARRLHAMSIVENISSQ